jgi:hypothetical protein
MWVGSSVRTRMWQTKYTCLRMRTCVYRNMYAYCHVYIHLCMRIYAHVHITNAPTCTSVACTLAGVQVCGFMSFCILPHTLQVFNFSHSFQLALEEFSTQCMLSQKCVSPTVRANTNPPDNCNCHLILQQKTTFDVYRLLVPTHEIAECNDCQYDAPYRSSIALRSVSALSYGATIKPV